jgi:hypothetical protein
VRQHRQLKRLVERFINTLPPALKTSFVELGIKSMGQRPVNDIGLDLGVLPGATIGLTALQDGASASAIETQDKRHELRARLQLVERFINTLPPALKTSFVELGIKSMGQRLQDGASASAIETQDKRHEQTLMQLEQGTLRSHFRVADDVDDLRARLQLVERFINTLPPALKTSFVELGHQR